jgi:hypothetical protein
MRLAASRSRRPERARRRKLSILDGYGRECEFVTRFAAAPGRLARLSHDLGLLNPQDVIAPFGLGTHG